MWSLIKGIFICCCLIQPLFGVTVEQRCLKCNSTELGCEEGLPRFVGNCSQEPDGCFTRVVDGVLIRGCLSQLPTAEERQQCAQVEGGACISCTENECNRHSWLKCLQCDDDEQARENCTDKQQARFCQQYRSEDRCYEVARVVNDQDQPRMARNCLSTLEIAGMHCNQSEHCVVLSTYDDRVKVLSAAKTSSKCLVCTSDELGEGEKCKQGTSAARDCLQPNDKCFSRLQGDVLQRNCLSTLTTEEQRVCADSNDATCVTCDAAGCNTERLPRCLQCKKSVDINCADPSMSSALTPTFCPRFQSSSSCYSRLIVDEVERGCTSAPGLPENVCEGNKRCLTCTEDGCNVISDTDLMNVQTCVRCGSRNGDNVACENASVEPVECDGLIDECFTRIQDGIVERNCLSTLSEEDQIKCKDDDDMTCVACIGHHCNDYTWLRCFRCSKLQDPRCAAPESNDLSVALCDGFQQEGQCYAKIVDEDVVRGCVIDYGSHVDVCEDNPMCSVCPMDGCNSVNEDTLRRYTKCITCTTSTVEGKEACEQVDPTTTALVCDELDDLCFTRVIDGHLDRGCLSSLDGEDQRRCKNPNDATCNTCQDLSCNNAGWLKCAKCTSLANPSCAILEEPALQELSSFCARHTSQSTCYSRLVQGVLERGCTLELAETESVCQGSTGCATCASDNCNTHTQESLLSGTKCVQCTSNGVGSDCNGELPNPEPCPNKDDRCFTRVDDGTLTRNCFSTLDASAQAACSNPDDLSCIICEESGCNRNHWIRCHQCDQTTHAACADEQHAGDSTYCKSYNAEDKCYTKILNDRLERGCQSDAGSGVDICSDAEVCLTCQEDACNNAPGSSLVYTKCQQCTSSEDPLCALGTVQSKSCPLQNDPCYTAVRNDGILVRGCVSMLNEELRAACNDEDNLSCVTCAESGCNGQQWPSCYRCKSSTDAKCDSSLTTDQLGFCESYRGTSLCYASISNDVLSRDCVGEESTVCENNNRCVACSTPGCNTITKETLDAVHTCYECDSSDGSCDITLEAMAKECNHRNDRCYMKLSNGVLTRGCLSDIDAEECNGNVQCMVCDGQACNNLSWPKCYQCSNTTSVDCSEAQQEIVSLNYCHHYSETACFALVETNSFVRGCVSDLAEDKCVEENPTTCVVCTGEGCNNLSQKSLFNPAACQRCHSDLDPGCMEGTVESVRCDNPDDVCFYRRTSGKSVHRGCLSELSSADQDRCRSLSGRSCHTCEQYGCNGAKWRACFQCNSITDGGCEISQNDTTHLKLCEKIDDFCFEDRSDTEVRRGCGLAYCEHKKTCLECDQDGCNGHSGSDLMPAHCLVCESSDPFCENGTRFDQYCDYLDEPCFSMVEDGTLYRGCFSHLREPHKGKCMDSKDKTCITCNGNSCNREPWRLCIQCRSVELGNFCSREASPLKSRYCKRYKQDDGCYAKEIDGVVTRGCESDYDSPEEVCKELDEKQCFLCGQDNCNDRSLNGAERLSQQAIGLYVAVATVRCLLWFV